MFNIFYTDKVDTTMNEIKKYPVGSLVVANEQTNGRGKDNRKWESLKSNNLYFSFSLDTFDKNINYSNYVFLTSLSVLKVIGKLINNEEILKCKWPNDILVNNKKFCGMLLEKDIQKGILVVGIGINVDSHPSINGKVLFEPTDLLNEGFKIDKFEFINNFNVYFEKQNKNFIENGFDNIRKEWLLHAYNLGKKITVKLKNKEYSGIFEDIDNDGTLIIRTKNGKKRIFSGDIF